MESEMETTQKKDNGKDNGNNFLGCRVQGCNNMRNDIVLAAVPLRIWRGLQFSQWVLRYLGRKKKDVFCIEPSACH